MSAGTAKRASWTVPSSSEKSVDLSSQSVPTAAQLAPLVNMYTINQGPPKTIRVPNASRLAQLQDVSVSGILLPKQIIKLDPRTNQRTVSTDPGGYRIETDGDLHFDLGVRPQQPHITCELQKATAWLSTFNRSVGKQTVVEGFFRCLFEHPGFDPIDDAHIFEVHPVRAVTIAGQIQSFDVGIPDQKSIHTWTSPNSLNKQDRAITVNYDRSSDALTFKGMDGKDENYVIVTGSVSNIQSGPTGGLAASFTLNSPDIGHPIQVYCLQGTTAALQLKQLKKTNVSMVVLRNIDLLQAVMGRYVINLLGIDIQPA
jgi:hypothetical protein